MKNINFRPIEENDLELLRRMFNDEDMNTLTVGQSFPVSAAQQLEWFRGEAVYDSGKFRYIIENSDGEAIGMGALGIPGDSARTLSLAAIKIMPEFQGKGYFRAVMLLNLYMAFNELNVELFTAECLEEQVKTMKMLEKMGFMLDGTLRRRVFKGGQYRSVCHWSMTRDEYHEKY